METGRSASGAMHLVVIALLAWLAVQPCFCFKLRRNPFSMYSMNSQPAHDISFQYNNRSTLLRAQCKAVCMRKMVLLDQSLNEAQKNAALVSEKLMETCLAKQSCAACERGCNSLLVRQHFESTAPIVCPQQCKGLPEQLVKPCTDSCRLLNDLMDDRRRSEPASHGAAGSQIGRNCSVNFDCGSLRCCKRQCGTCEQTVPFPTILDVSESESGDALPDNRQMGFELEWTVPDNVPVDGPIVYVVDVRSQVGQTFEEDRASPWSTALMTTSKGAFLKGIRVGELYKFRLAAVSPDGTQGYSAPTQAKRSSLEPQAPSPPENLREENRITRPDGLIDIHFGWEPPMHTDLEVTKYKLFWFQKTDVAGGRQRASREMKKTVPASQLSFALEQLHADLLYCFAVQALCDFDSRKLRSQRSVLCVNTSHSASQDALGFTTPSVLTTPAEDDSEELDITQDYADWDNDNDFDTDNDNEVPNGSQRHDADSRVDETEENDLSASPSRSLPFSLLQASVTQPLYEQDELRATVSWSHVSNRRNTQHALKYTVIWRPLACDDSLAEHHRPQTTVSVVTESRQAVLSGLRFACQYHVLVRLLATETELGNETVVVFSTPRCSDVVVKSGRPPLCPTTPAPKLQVVVPAPKNVQVRLIESWTRQSWSKYYHAFVNWTSNERVPRYRVVYGRKSSQSTSSSPRIEKGGAITKVVTGSHTSLLDLEADTTYVLQLQALSEQGDSRVVQVHFTTSDNVADKAPPTPLDIGRKPARKLTNSASRSLLQTSVFALTALFYAVRLCFR